MSKKKVSGSTMTLKDFHGGSIPCDLPLPSAPGVTVRSSDHSGYDRPSSWGASMGRPDHWSRPHTSPAIRHYDERTLFFPHAPLIGRNFDEDERKPLDGGSAKRRTTSDDSIRAMPSRIEVKPKYGVGGSSLGRQLAPVPHAGTVNLYSARLTEVVHVGVNSQSVGGSSNMEHGTSIGGGHTNVWALRKGAASSVEPEKSYWSRPNAVSKLENASALEKVSSGRWQSKAVHHRTDPEVVRSSEVESGPCASVNGYNAYNKEEAVGEREYYDAMLARHAERNLGMDSSMRGGRSELLDYERSGVPMYSEVQPRSIAHHAITVQLAQSDGKLSGSGSLHPMPSEPNERPKLKLLPKVKPLERKEPYVTKNAQVQGHANLVKPVSNENENGKEVGQRLKLNLKPRSQPVEQLEGNAERERNALFGGARPRELVLKERGVDDAAINSYDVVDHSHRVGHNILRIENLTDRTVQTCFGEKHDDALHDQGTGRKPEWKEQRVDTERVHVQRNWRGDNRRNVTKNDRPQAIEKPKSPETWRKPVNEPKSSHAVVGVRYGRAASAVELAQAFSRPVSDPKVNNRVSDQRGPNTGRMQMPFSRLVSPTSRPQINGY